METLKKGIDMIVQRVKSYTLSKLDLDGLLKLVGMIFSKAIILARKCDMWEQFKRFTVVINHWTTVLLEIYDDDKMTPEEELRLANELKNTKFITKVSEVINRVKSDDSDNLTK